MNNLNMTPAQKDRLVDLKSFLKEETYKLVSKDQEIFANLSDEKKFINKKERAKGFREDNKQVLIYKILSTYWFTEKWAQMLLDSNLGRQIPYDLELFEWLDHKEWLWKLVNSCSITSNHIFENLPKFKWLDATDYQKLAQKDLWYWGHDAAWYLKNFKHLDKETAKLFITKWYHQRVAFSLESFDWLDKDIFLMLAEKWLIWLIYNHLECFEWLDDEAFQMMLIYTSDADLYTPYIEAYKQSKLH